MAGAVVAIVIVATVTIAGAITTTVAMIGLVDEASHAFLAAQAAMIQATFVNIPNAAAAVL